MKIVTILTVLFVVLLTFSGGVHAENTGCLTAGFWVEDTFYNFFDPAKNQASKNTFEQWSQRQIDEWNKMLSASGVRDCFKIGKIVRVPDGALPLNGGLPTNHPDKQDRENDVVWGFPKSVLEKDGQRSRDYWTSRLNGVDWGLLHELSHARYVDDSYAYNVDTGVDVVEVKDPSGKPIVGTYLKPVVGSLLYINKSEDFMNDHEGKHFYAPHAVGAFNRVAGQHYANEFGNYNHPSNAGEYTNDLPSNNILRIFDTQGVPLSQATIKIYRSQSKRQGVGKLVDATADYSGVTNERGEVSIGHNPFIDGKITHPNYGVFLAEISYDGKLLYRFFEVSDFNLAYWSGATDIAVYDVKTPFVKVNIPASSVIISQPQITALEPSLISPPGIFVIRGTGFGTQQGSIDILDERGSEYWIVSTYKVIDWADTHITVEAQKHPFNAYIGRKWRIVITTADNQKAQKEWLTVAEAVSQPTITINPRTNQAAPTPTISFRALIATQIPTNSPTPMEIQPTVTLVPLPGQHQIESLVISNYPDFREGKALGDAGSETVKISNPLESQTLPWVRSTINPNPIYIRKINTDGTQEELSLSLDNNQSTQIEGITIMSNVKRKLVRMLINGDEVDLSNKHYRLQLKGDASVTLFTVPVILYFSSGNPQYLTWNFTYSASSSSIGGEGPTREPTVTLVPLQSSPILTPTSSVVCKWEDRDPECDWTLKQVYEVKQNSCTGEYQKLNYHTQVGACGAVATAKSTETTKSPSQPTANGCVWKQLDPECDWTLKQVYEVYKNSCTGGYDKRNYQTQPGACGAALDATNAAGTCTYSEGFTKGDGSFGIRECTGTKQEGVCKYNPGVEPRCTIIQ